MNSIMLRKDIKKNIDGIGEVDILVGVPSYNNARTIGHVVKEDIGEREWNEAYKTVRGRLGLDEEQPLSSKNSHVVAATLEQLWKDGNHSKSLDRLCDAILAFAIGASGDDSQR